MDMELPLSMSPRLTMDMATTLPITTMVTVFTRGLQMLSQDMVTLSVILIEVHKDSMDTMVGMDMDMDLQSCSGRGCAMCGATLLNKRYAMTAMHCVTEATNLVVALGEHNIRQDVENHKVQGIQVAEVIKRADYNTNSIDND